MLPLGTSISSFPNSEKYGPEKTPYVDTFHAVSLMHKVIKYLHYEWCKDNSRRKFLFHRNYFTFYNRDWNSNSQTNFGMTCGKYSMEFLSDIAVEIAILEISTMNF